MTGAVLSALNGVDEEYLSSYENRKPTKTAYLKNRKVLAAAAALVIAISTGAILISVGDLGQDRDFYRMSFSSYESFVRSASLSLDGEESLLSAIDPAEYADCEYYRVCKKNVGNYSQLGVLGPDIFIVRLVRNGKTCEIAYQPNANDSSAMPDRFRTEAPYSESIVINGVSVAYRERKKLTEGEFTADSGYYKVICYSDLFSDFSGFVTELLN